MAAAGLIVGSPQGGDLRPEAAACLTQERACLPAGWWSETYPMAVEMLLWAELKSRSVSLVPHTSLYPAANILLALRLGLAAPAKTFPLFSIISSALATVCLA